MFSARRNSGFSLLELTIVVAIALTVSAMAIPSITTTIANVRIRSNIASVSGLLQSCRMLAVNQNKTKTAHFTSITGGLIAYVKNASDGASLATGDAQVMMEAPITKLTEPAGTGAPTAMTSTDLGYTPQTGDPSFNTRGLPCLYAAGICTNYGFISYFKDTRRSGSEGWAAITVSPAGRITKWFWNGSSWGN